MRGFTTVYSAKAKDIRLRLEHQTGSEKVSNQVAQPTCTGVGSLQVECFPCSRSRNQFLHFTVAICVQVDDPGAACIFQPEAKTTTTGNRCASSIPAVPDSDTAIGSTILDSNLVVTTGSSRAGTAQGHARTSSTTIDSTSCRIILVGVDAGNTATSELGGIARTTAITWAHDVAAITAGTPSTAMVSAPVVPQFMG